MDDNRRGRTATKLEYLKVFISYCWVDKNFVWSLADRLKAQDLSVWIDKREIEPADRIPEQVQKALVECDILILMWSQASSRSDWVKDEWNAALAYRKRTIPCVLDDMTLPGRLEDVLYIDFRDREQGMQMLLQALAKPVDRPPKHIFSSHPDLDQRIQNIPYGNNPNFTGRQEYLDTLRRLLVFEKTTAITQPVSISGLGGVGKTQIATRYAHLYEENYELIWWLRSEGPLTLAADYSALAVFLDLPEKHEREQQLVLRAVKKWLEQHGNWLLIFDNAQTPDVVRPFLPRSRNGHVLITSRNQNWLELASPVPIKEWQRQESIKFLFRRTGQSDEEMASAIADVLGDLPLALEQAGAYIEATRCPFADYFKLFQNYHRELLKRFKPHEYPESVATTWVLSMQKIREKSPNAADLLNLCAFLAPDNIPRDLLGEGTDPLVFNDSISALNEYSLIEAQSNTLSIHRLVQAVTRDHLLGDKKKTWAEASVRLVADAYPSEHMDARFWPKCIDLLPHALTTTKYSDEQKVALEKVTTLLKGVGMYLWCRGRYAEAEPSLLRALELREKTYGLEHPAVADSLNDLALLRRYHQDKNDEAETLFRRALQIYEKMEGPNSVGIAVTLDNLADLLGGLDRSTEGISLSRRALGIWEKQLGPEHLDFATSLNNYGMLLDRQGHHAEAELQQRRSLEIAEKQLGPNHPDMAAGMHNLAHSLMNQGNYVEAETFCRRALDIWEKELGLEHRFTKLARNLLEKLLSKLKSTSNS